MIVLDVISLTHLLFKSVKTLNVLRQKLVMYLQLYCYRDKSTTPYRQIVAAPDRGWR